MEQNILLFILVGFIAQMIDGALGMAYGVISNTFLLSLGLSPVAASASLHAAELATTAISGLSHFRLGNVDDHLWKRLVIPGALGGMMGAYLLTKLPGEAIKPYVAIYLFAMGALIVLKALREVAPQQVITHLTPIGFVGGFLDAVGGGGWGPIVTSTLVARGNHPRFTVGSVNSAEFFVTLSQSLVFILTIGFVHWQIIVGLLLGGVIAAPLAAFVCRILPSRALMFIVGGLIIALSLRTLYLTWLA